MASVKIQPAPLSGSIFAQPSKSMAHRAIICAALAEGESRIENIVLSDDIMATLGAIKALGAEAKLVDSTCFKGRKSITVRSQGGITVRGPVIDCMESGSTARFIMPLTRLSGEPVTFTGRGRLIERPFSIYAELFQKNGVVYTDHEGKMPITLTNKLRPGEFQLPGNVSSQFVTGLLFTLPLLPGSSKIVISGSLESLSYVKMTLSALRDFGVAIAYDADYRHFEIPGGQAYQPVPCYVVEGDWSQAAFFCVMGAVSESIALKGLKLDSIQGDRAILDILQKMGALYQADSEGIIFKKSTLRGREIDVSQCPDLVPAIAVAAALAKGTTHIANAARLRIKESDRLASVTRGLCALGAKITEEPEGLIIEGISNFTGGCADGAGDHRIVMALAAASAASRGMIEIQGSDAVKKSYPAFWEDFKMLGGRIEER
ncbi:MAG TPA: 3-phosphoshikimate 1-carboxyvinyltransferase [Ruminiclostridium sp.]|nr:3-phosphoshikimate 1-carboxyvinyltransferase [Ruminiclostridium sp.]